MTINRQTREALRQSGEHYRALFESLNDAVFVVDFQGRFLEVNPTAIERLGYSWDELRTMTVRDIDTPEAAARVSERMACIKDKGHALFETTHVRRDGRLIPVEISSRLIQYQDQPVVLSVVRDITERKQVEEALRKGERQLRLLTDNSSDVIVTLELSGRFTYVTPSIQRLLGYTAQEFVQQAMEHMVAPFSLPKVVERLNEINARVESGQRVESGILELELRRKDGSTVWTEVTFSGMYDPADLCVGIVASCRDITERKEANQQQQRLSTVIEQSAEAVVIADADARILYVNPAFEKITGYRRAEVIGQNPRILKSGKQDAAFYQNLWSTLTRGESWHGHFVNKRKDGSLYEEEATISPVCDPPGQIVNFVAVKRDVTKEAGLQQQLFQAQKMDAVGRLAGGVAHDFNNLLMVIGGYSKLLLKKLSPGGHEHQMAEEIEHTAERAAALTRQLLTFSRKQVSHPELMNFNRMILEAENIFPQLLREDIRVVQRCDSDLSDVMADPVQMHQVLMNLLINARDAMPSGGILTLETSNLHLERPEPEHFPDVPKGHYATLTVKDTGCGISPEAQAHLFEPFFTTKTKDKGTGLGLSIVFGIVHQAGGYIAVESKVGQGTSFTILLSQAMGKIGGETKVSSAPENLMGSETILLIEDADRVRKMIRLLLESQGYHVLVASSGEEAWEQYRQHSKSVHLMLSDIVLPGINGMDLTRKIRLQCPQLKVILMSGYSDDRIMKEVQSEPRLTFLSKPVSPDALLRKLREQLDEDGE